MENKEVKLIKIRSGYNFFYLKNYYCSILIKNDMADTVNCDILQHALDRTILRYPYLKLRIVWKDNDIYLTENNNPLTVGRGNKMRGLGSPENGFHLIDVYGYGHTICLHAHHGIADGNGILPFLRTLLYCYLCEYYGKNFKPGNINLPDSPISPEETAEPCGEEFYPVTDNTAVKVSLGGYGMPEYMVIHKEQYDTHISFPMSELVPFMKQKDSSPAIILSIFLSQAIERVHPDHEGNIFIPLAWNYRSAIGMDKTHKNCSFAVFLNYNDRIKKLPLDMQGTCFRGMTFAQTRESDAIRIINQQIALMKKLDTLNGYEEKSAALSPMSVNCVKTFFMSYAGQMALGECEEKIKDQHIIVSSYGGMMIEMASVNGRISMNIETPVDFPDYFDAFCDILTENGVHCRREKTEKIVFPESAASAADDAKAAGAVL